ncbi:single-stranded DNA-binding protein [Magnetofaba australis]|uniref:Putative single-strand binding protein/primosomal replication protein n n=1 Tax=Magnetofaba australis IT-1 TaxID=1434232 RepID=A0A1Y2K3E4_9PROT|nr:single-stranded DNA-binding protein [Magnetofaba australis]OSM02578.1 putative single-strand binding protein/primosomal replication protein n [Magnetofaba australis IT-1]
MSAPSNHVVLQGALQESVEMRYTPAGAPIATLMLLHEGPADGVALLERLHLLIPVRVIGDLAHRCDGLQPGQLLRVEGGLNQPKRTRNGALSWGKMELIARRLEILPPAQSQTSSAQSVTD